MGMVMQGWGIFVVMTFKTRQDLSVEFEDMMALILMRVILKSSFEPWSFKTELWTSYHARAWRQTFFFLIKLLKL